MAFGLLMTVVGLGALCVLFYTCLVYALPFAVGVWTAYLVIHFGGGPVAGIALGCFIGGAALGLCQFALAHARPGVTRLLVLSIFVLPAFLAGYGAGLEISKLMVSSSLWQQIYAAAGAIIVGATAAARIAAAREGDWHSRRASP